MSLVTERLQNPKMCIFFCGKKWIPPLWNKADSCSRKEQVCVNTSRAGHGYKEMWLYVNSACWRASQLLLDNLRSVVSDQPFVLKDSFQRAESVLVSPLHGPAEVWLAAKLSRGDNCSTQLFASSLFWKKVQDYGTWQDTSTRHSCATVINATQWKTYMLQYILHVCCIDMLLWRACICQKYIYTYLLCDRVKWIEEWVLCF